MKKKNINARFFGSSRSCLFALLCASSVQFALVAKTHAQEGLIDPTFLSQIETTRVERKEVSLFPLPNGKLMAAGSFNSYDGQTVGSLIRINHDGGLDETFNKYAVSSFSYTAIPHVLPNQDGSILVAGTFTISDGTEYVNDIVRINAEGVIDGSFEYAESGFIASIEFDQSGRILVSGDLTVPFEGSAVPRNLVRILATGGVDTSFDAPTAEFVNRVQGNRIISERTDVPNQSGVLFRLNEDGSVDNTFSNPFNFDASPSPHLWIFPNGDILWLGFRKLIKVRKDGDVDSGFDPIIFTNQPYNFFLEDDGAFRVVDVVGAGARLIRYRGDGTLDTTYPEYPFEFNHRGAQAGDAEHNIYIEDTGNNYGNRFVRLDQGGIEDPLFNQGRTGFQNIVPSVIKTAAVVPGGKILIGGDFDRVNGIDRSYIARLNADGSIDPGFAIPWAGPNSFISILDVFSSTLQTDGKILFSGHFEYSINGESKQNIVRLEQDGRIDPTFSLYGLIEDYYSPTRLSQNRTRQTSDGNILVGTSFIGGDTEVPQLLTTGGAKVTGFAPLRFPNSHTIAAFDVELQAQKFLVAGFWSGAVGKQEIGSGFVYRLNPDGSIDESFDGSFFENRQPVIDIEDERDGRFLVVEGRFLSGRVWRIGPNGGIDTAFFTGAGTNGVINAIKALDNGIIVVGGEFSEYNGQPRKNVAFLNPDGTLNPLILNTDLPVYSIETDDKGRILIGGQFTSLNTGDGNFDRSSLVRLNKPEVFRSRAILDFEGDGRTDISVFRSSAGDWYIQHSSDGNARRVPFGDSNDIPVPSDYTGDGRSDIAFFRPSTGEWFVLRSEDSSYYSFPFGQGGDIPAPGDFDGDGTHEAGIFRPATGEWFAILSGGGTMSGKFGVEGDRPIVADFDGDAKDDIAVYRKNANQWWINASSEGVTAATFGTGGDIPVYGDYTGDLKADIAVFRPSTGEWFVLRSDGTGVDIERFGSSGDIPVRGDYDGDGRSDKAVYRPGDGFWYISGSSSGVAAYPFGLSTDVPLAGIR